MPLKRRRLFLIYFILFLLVPAIAQASDLTLQRKLHKNFNKSRVLLAKVERALASGQPYQDSLAELKELGKSIRTDHQALFKKFNARGKKLDMLGAKAVSRHAAMQDRYQQFVSRYLFSLDALSNSQAPMDEVLQLKLILEDILPKKKRRIHGSIPYHHLNLPAQKPQYSPEILPAYKGGDQGFAGADLTSSPEAHISPTIAKLAKSLNWNPVEMYEWVKNNVKTEWYWGVMKGAEETLRQMSGNDSDQATLLVALFRSAGFPARYVRGVIEFFPDIETAKDQIGLDDPLEIAGFFQKAGIPYETAIAGGGISNFRIEHIWVEVLIPYDNYRGALLDEHGKTWLPLDTSIKTVGYAANTPDDTLTTLDLTGIRESYLAGIKAGTPLEYLAAQINDQLSENGSGITYDDLLVHRTINQEHMKIIPAGLQFTETALTGEYANLPDELMHKARFSAATNDGTLLFDQTIPMYRLSNRSIALTFEPETIEDQEIMNGYGGLDNTPLYLIHLRPLITVEGSREIVGKGGIAAGSDFSLAVELVAPATKERVENIVVAGYPTIIGLSAGQAVTPDVIPLEEKDAERLLFERAMSYIDRVNTAEEELASLFQIHLVRPLPTLVTLGGVLDVVYLLDSPHGFTWKGVYLDAAMRFVELFGGVSPSDSEPAQLFMQLASLENSILENRIFEDGFEVESVSTAKLLAFAGDKAIPVAVIDAENVDADLPLLNLPDSISDDIADAVNQGFVITIPETELFYEDWFGFVYIKENPVTYESGWMLSGEIAGGMTAWGLDRWPDYFLNHLTNPFLEPPNTDPDSGVSLQKVVTTDMQTAVVGTTLKETMQVIARDNQNTPVQGAWITFTVKAGGGTFEGNADSFRVQTDINGIAEAVYTLGKCTGSCSAGPQGNPTTRKLKPSDTYQTQIGSNIIDAALDSGVHLTTPFTQYALPGTPKELKELAGGNTSGYVLTWIGLAGVRVEDEFGNPVANVAVDFTIDDPVEKNSCPANPNKDERTALLIENDAPCMSENTPLYGQCGSEAVHGLQSYTTGEASVQVMLGGMPDAEYLLTASATDTTTSTVTTLTTYPFGSCEGYSIPSNRIIINAPHLVDGNGNIVNAAKVGSSIPMRAKVFWIMEKEELMSLDIPCENETFHCNETIVGGREYNIITEFDSESVTFNGQHSVSSGLEKDKIFDIMFDVGSEPGKKNVVIHADTEKEIRVNKDMCSDNCRIDEEPKKLSDDLTVEVYAVDIAISKELLVPVSETGYTLHDVEIPFEILPAEYTAALSTVVVMKDNVPIQYIPAERQGSGFGIITAGFKFDRGSSYTAQVTLNMGSDLIEINSNPITLELITLELNADLNRDNIYLEDDPEEETAPGLILSVNHNDDDGDGIADRLDGFNLDPAIPEDDVFTDPSGAPLIDNDLIPIQLHGLPTDLNQGTITLEIVNGQDKVRILSDNTKEYGTDSILIDTTDPDAATGKLSGSTYEWQLGNIETPTIAALPSFIYVEGINSSTSSGDVRLAIKYSKNQGEEIETDTIVMTVVQVDIAMDGNRDGEINFDNKEDKQYLFWVNDDHDLKHFDEGIPQQDDDEEGPPDWDDNYIGNSNKNGEEACERDLEDFTRLQLKVDTALANMSGVTYHLSFQNQSKDDPNINIFEAVDCSEDYLNDPVISSNQLNKTKLLTVSNKEELLDSQYVMTDGTNSCFLLEGNQPGSGELTLTIKKDRIFLLETSVELEIHPIKWFYDIYSTSVVDGDRWEVEIQSTAIHTQTASYNPKTDDKFLFVHGWNMEEWEKERWTETIFKRLWWQGYQGSVALFSWPTLSKFEGFWDVLTEPYHFDNSEFRAWLSAGSLVGVFKELNSDGKLRVLAHSMGNIVVGEALRQYSQHPPLHTYIASQAALSAQYYDNSVAELQPAEHSLGYPITTPDIFGHYDSGDVNTDPYLEGNSPYVERMFNYYNARDWALEKWAINNVMKPDNFVPYYFNYIGSETEYREGVDQFYRGLQDNAPEILRLSNQRQRFMIFSYTAESRSVALGQAENGEFDGWDLENQLDYNDEHYSHSKQFRSHIRDEWPYWERVIDDCDFDTIQ